MVRWCVSNLQIVRSRDRERANEWDRRTDLAGATKSESCHFLMLLCFDSRYCCAARASSEQRAPWHSAPATRRDATRREFASIMAAVALWHRHGRMRGGKGNREESSPRGIDAECRRRAMSPYVGLVTWSSTRSGPSELPHFLMIFIFTSKSLHRRCCSSVVRHHIAGRRWAK